jgi:dihydrofolate reductase
MSFSIIAAIAKNGVISKNNKMPWNIPEDLAYFYKMISGKTIIMGRKTFESIGHPVKNSENVVLSHDQSLHLPGCVVVHSFAEILRRFENRSDEIMIIGGAAIFEYFLPKVSRMYLTLINQEVDGDIYFPKWEQKDWIMSHKRDAEFGIYSYSFVVLERKIGKL